MTCGQTVSRCPTGSPCRRSAGGVVSAASRRWPSPTSGWMRSYRCTFLAAGCHALRRALAPGGGPLLALACRLSPEKQPLLAIDTLRTLRRRGVPAHLVIAGDGPEREVCERAAVGLPVKFTGFIAQREPLAELLASADVVLAPCPVETFGLSALEALASGTPVVGRRAGALPELLETGAGAVAYGHPASFADAVVRTLAADARQRRSDARAHAERFGWHVTIDRMLGVHRLAARRAA